MAAEEKIADLMTLTAEPGVIGGIPADGNDFGAATNAQAVRAKLGSALESRGVAPHIYESEAEAAGAVRATLPRQE